MTAIRSFLRPASDRPKCGRRSLGGVREYRRVRRNRMTSDDIIIAGKIWVSDPSNRQPSERPQLPPVYAGRAEKLPPSGGSSGGVAKVVCRAGSPVRLKEP
jgi:hypothetical protein